MSSSEDILKQFKDGTITMDEVQEKLKALKVSDTKKVTYKPSVKGAISFYAIRRMPITLYKEELQIIVDIANGPEFKKFLLDNADKLSTKDKSQ